MMKRSPIPGFLLCLSLSSAVPGLAQTDPIERLQREGWTAVQEGVLQRQQGPGEVETYAFGVEGFTWKLRDLRSRLQVLRREHAANPTPELRKAIASHRKLIASTRERIERARIAEAGGKYFGIWDGGCNLAYGLDAEASHKVNIQGTWASAGASFKSSAYCGPYAEYGQGSGQVYAYAFTKTTVNGAPTTMAVDDGPRTGSNVSASAEAHRNGGSACESHAYSEVTSGHLELASYSRSKTSTTCPVASSLSALQVSVTAHDHGFYPFVVWEERCLTVTWRVNVSGGTPFYTASIYRNGVFQRTGTSYSEQFCFDQDYEDHYEEYGEYKTVTISAQVTDSGSQSKSGSDTQTLRYRWLLD